MSLLPILYFSFGLWAELILAYLRNRQNAKTAKNKFLWDDLVKNIMG
jgi:hypothetical protein